MKRIFTRKYSHVLVGLCGLFGALTIALLFGGSHVFADTGIGSGGAGGGGGGNDGYKWKVAGDGTPGHAWSSYYRSPPCGISCTPKFGSGGEWNNILSICQSAPYIWYKVNNDSDGYMVSNGYEEGTDVISSEITALPAPPSAAGKLSYGYWRDGISLPALRASGNTFAYIICSALPSPSPNIVLACNDDGTGYVDAHISPAGVTIGRITMYNSRHETTPEPDLRTDGVPARPPTFPYPNTVRWTVPASYVNTAWRAELRVSYYGTSIFSNIPLASGTHNAPCAKPNNTPTGILRMVCDTDATGQTTILAKMYWDDETSFDSPAYLLRPADQTVRYQSDTFDHLGIEAGHDVYTHSFTHDEYVAYRGQEYRLHVKDQKADHTYAGADVWVDQADAPIRMPTCDNAPTATVNVGCSLSGAITITNATDPEASPDDELRVDVYQNGSATSASSKRVFSGKTATGGVLTIPRSQINSGTLAPGGAANATKPITAGDDISWNSVNTWVYIINVKPDGTEGFLAAEAHVFDGGPNDDGAAEHKNPPGPCARVSCIVDPANYNGVTFNGPLVPNVPSTVTVSVKVDDALSPAPAPFAPFRVKINGNVSNPAYNAAISNGTKLYSVTTSFTPTATGDLDISWGSTWASPSNAATPFTCSTDADNPPQITNKPYFNVLGGDIAAGLPFGGVDDSCDQSESTLDALKTSNIKSWNLDNVGGTDYDGAGTDYAALATGQVRSFISNNSKVATLSANGGGNFKPTDLVFANDPSHAPSHGIVDATNGKYGGGVGKLGCMSDQFNKLYDAAQDTDDTSYSIANANADIEAHTKKTKYYSGDLTVSSGSISEGRALVLIVKGSVYIDGDIGYDYDSVINVPNVTIIAKQGIYISGNSHALHGNFYSLGAPRIISGSGTVFATCAIVLGDGSFKEIAATGDCNSKLDIYGSVSAKTVHLDRTIGSIGGASGAAETFHYSPESWITQVAGPICTNDCPYNNIAGLPPVL